MADFDDYAGEPDFESDADGDAVDLESVASIDELRGALNAYACEALATGLADELGAIDIGWDFANSVALQCDRAADRLVELHGARFEYDSASSFGDPRCAAILPGALVDSILLVLEDFLTAAGIIREDPDAVDEAAADPADAVARLRLVDAVDDPAEPSDDDAAPPYVVTPDGAWATADRLRCSHAAFTADATRLVELSFVFSGAAAAGEQRVTALREAFLASDAWRVEPAIRKLKARHGAEGTLLLVECDALAGLSADPSGPALAADAPRHKGKKRGGKRKLPAGK